MGLQQTIATAGSKQQAESVCTITRAKQLKLQGHYIPCPVSKQDATVVNLTTKGSGMYPT